MVRKFTHLMSSLVVFLIIIFYHSVYANADQLILNNGDRLTGTIISLEQGMLIIQPAYAEPIIIKKEEIDGISTDMPAEIHLEGGEILKGNITTTEDGYLSVETSRGREAALIRWEQVIAINPALVISPKWKGSVTLGANLQSGNTDRSSLSIGAEAARKTEQDRFFLRFLYNYAEENKEITARNAYGSLKYDYFFKKSLYGFVGIELLNDKFKNLNLRTIIGPGIGYQIWDDQIRSLSFDVGISYFSEDRKEGKDSQWFTGRLASDLSYKVLDSVIISNQLIIYPSLRNVGEFQLRNEAAVTSALGVKWALKFINIFEHDSDPPEGIKKNDLYWILALQYSF